MENATKAIIIAASVLITMAIVTIGFLIMNTGKNTVTIVTDKIDTINTEQLEYEYTMYDNKVVSGNTVLDAIRKFEKQHIGICVITGIGGTTNTNWYINDASDVNNLSSTYNTIRDAEDIQDPTTYINPSGRFKGEIKRDNTGRIASITFTQE